MGSNKVVVQWDTRADEVALTYDEHLAAVNSITYIDENRRFISSSVKKVFIWEYGIPVVMKHISEPEMNSIPKIAITLNKKFWVGQSLDNTICVYGCARSFKMNVKKRFKGHLNSGYAADVGVSPDGAFVYSGDANGRMFYWDWKTCKIFKRMDCHDRVVIGSA